MLTILTGLHPDPGLHTVPIIKGDATLVLTGLFSPTTSSSVDIFATRTISTMQINHSTPSHETYVLPDLLCISTPFKPSMNPHWAKAASESSAWVSSYNIFSDQKLTEFIACSLELLTAYTYPHADYDSFRTCCDFMNLTFVIDELSDLQNGEDARLTGDIYLNALRDAEWTGGSALAEMTKE